MFEEILIQTEDEMVRGYLSYPSTPLAWIIFANDSTASGFNPTNILMAEKLNEMGFATFFLDLVTEAEEELYQTSQDINLLTKRLLIATQWLIESEYYNDEPIAYFGMSAGSSAAVAATAQAEVHWPVYALVSRGGRPDLAAPHHLASVDVPTLLLVGSLDEEMVKFNQKVQNFLTDSKLIILEGASPYLEEDEALEEVIKLSTDWLIYYLPNRGEDIYQL